MKRDLTILNVCIIIGLSMLLAFCSVTGDTPVETDSPVIIPPKTATSVTLLAPQRLTTTYLIDEEGTVVNTWESNYTPGLSAYLLEDKSLLRCANPGTNTTFGRTGGAGGMVERFDWDGNKTWEFRYDSPQYLHHHDIEYLPNGNILMIAWEYKSSAEAIAAGRNPSLLSEGSLWPDSIIEVKPEGTSGGVIVWEWHVWDHLVQDYDSSKANYGSVSANPGKINLNYVMMRGSADWNHVNAVDYNPELDQIMLTSHHFSEIWIIDHTTTTAGAAGPAGDLLYRWGNPRTYDRGAGTGQQLFVPHNGQWIKDDCPGAGDILVFNNGSRRPGGNYSTVDQFTPALNGDGGYTLYTGAPYGPAAPNWTYASVPPTDFYADRISGAQRLNNGNTLICDGPAGTFFEVTPEGDTVREFVNPYTARGPMGNSMFRAPSYWVELD